MTLRSASEPSSDPSPDPSGHNFDLTDSELDLPEVFVNSEFDMGDLNSELHSQVFLGSDSDFPEAPNISSSDFYQPDILINSEIDMYDLDTETYDEPRASLSDFDLYSDPEVDPHDPEPEDNPQCEFDWDEEPEPAPPPPQQQQQQQQPARRRIVLTEETLNNSLANARSRPDFFCCVCCRLLFPEEVHQLNISDELQTAGVVLENVAWPCFQYARQPSRRQGTYCACKSHKLLTNESLTWVSNTHFMVIGDIFLCVSEPSSNFSSIH